MADRMNGSSLLDKILISCLVVVIGFLAYSSLIDRALDETSLKIVDRQAEEYFERTLIRAVSTFAVVRGLNAAISVIQGTEVSVSPGGVGVVMSVGEAVDPVNDLLERFSWIMLISSASLGIQRVLMDVGAWLGLRFLLTLALAVILIGIWLPRLGPIWVTALGYRLLILALAVRFCIPAVAVASEKIYDLFLEESYVEATRSLESITEDVQKQSIVSEADEAEQSWFDKLIGAYDRARETANIRGRINYLKDKMTRAAEYIINLIVVFALQTVVIPLLVLWLLIRIAGNAAGGTVLYVMERKIRGREAPAKG